VRADVSEECVCSIRRVETMHERAATLVVDYQTEIPDEKTGIIREPWKQSARGLPVSVWGGSRKGYQVGKTR
jgi:hypothetical protein